MNKNDKQGIIIAVVLAVLLIAFIVFYVLTDDGTTYHLEPLAILGIVLGGVLLVCLVAICVMAIVIASKFKRVVKCYNNKAYREVVEKYDYFAKLRPSQIKDAALLTIAVSYLELGDDERFCSISSQVNHKNVLIAKYFWQAVYAIGKNDANEFLRCQDLVTQSTNNNRKVKYVTMLDIVYKYNCQQYQLTESDKQLICSFNSDFIKTLVE